MTVDRDHLRKLAEAASRGPWTASGGYVSADSGRDGISGYSTRADAAFIAAARQAVPMLLDENEALREKLDRAYHAAGENAIALLLTGLGEEVQTRERYSNAVALAQAVQRADRAEARIRAVEDVLDSPPSDIHDGTDHVNAIRRVLDGEA